MPFGSAKTFPISADKILFSSYSETESVFNAWWYKFNCWKLLLLSKFWLLWVVVAWVIKPSLLFDGLMLKIVLFLLGDKMTRSLLFICILLVEPTAVAWERWDKFAAGGARRLLFCIEWECVSNNWEVEVSHCVQSGRARKLGTWIWGVQKTPL